MGEMSRTANPIPVIDGRLRAPNNMMPPLNQFKRCDVREMIRGGIEPFPFICERVAKLKPDAGIIIVAPFLPSPLIEKLGSEGFASKVERGKGTDWLVYLWREPVRILGPGP